MSSETETCTLGSLSRTFSLQAWIHILDTNNHVFVASLLVLVTQTLSCYLWTVMFRLWRAIKHETYSSQLDEEFTKGDNFCLCISVQETHELCGHWAWMNLHSVFCKDIGDEVMASFTETGRKALTNRLVFDCLTLIKMYCFSLLCFGLTRMNNIILVAANTWQRKMPEMERLVCSMELRGSLGLYSSINEHWISSSSLQGKFSSFKDSHLWSTEQQDWETRTDRRSLFCSQEVYGKEKLMGGERLFVTTFKLNQSPKGEWMQEKESLYWIHSRMRHDLNNIESRVVVDSRLSCRLHSKSM
jgi:hypothetical protein